MAAKIPLKTPTDLLMRSSTSGWASMVWEGRPGNKPGVVVQGTDVASLYRGRMRVESDVRHPPHPASGHLLPKGRRAEASRQTHAYFSKAKGRTFQFRFQRAGTQADTNPGSTYRKVPVKLSGRQSRQSHSHPDHPSGDCVTVVTVVWRVLKALLLWTWPGGLFVPDGFVAGLGVIEIFPVLRSPLARVSVQRGRRGLHISESN